MYTAQKIQHKVDIFRASLEANRRSLCKGAKRHYQNMRAVIPYQKYAYGGISFKNPYNTITQHTNTT